MDNERTMDQPALSENRAICAPCLFLHADQRSEHNKKGGGRSLGVENGANAKTRMMRFIPRFLLHSGLQCDMRYSEEGRIAFAEERVNQIHPNWDGADTTFSWVCEQ